MVSVLQVLPGFNAGGVERTTLAIANALAQKGVPSFVVSAGGQLLEKLHPNVHHFTLPLTTKNPLSMLLNVIRLWRIICKHGITIVHARSRAPGWSAYIAAKLAKVRFITTYHGTYSQGFFKWYYNKVMAFGKPTITISDFIEQHVKKHYPFASTFFISSGGIDMEYFKPSDNLITEGLKYRSQWQVEKDQKVIVLVGRFTKIKGHFRLLEAINENNVLKKNCHIVFVGDGKNMELIASLKKYAEKHKIILHCHLDETDFRPFFQTADIVVVPSIKPEAFGMVTVEAMSMEKCVIVSDLGASPKVLGDRNWIYGADDSTALSNKLLEMINISAKEQEEIGKKNRVRATSHYGLRSLVDAHLKVYFNN